MLKNKIVSARSLGLTLSNDEEILEFLDLNSLPFEQRDENWLNFIAKSIGGSDAGMLNRKNPVDAIVKKKRQPMGNYSIIPCIWGTMFERVGERLAEICFKTKLRGSDSCVVGPYGSHYSPDGICFVEEPFSGMKTMSNRPLSPRIAAKRNRADSDVANVNADSDVANDNADGENKFTAVIEIKMPFSRVADGGIMSDYLAQETMGLCIIPATKGVFVDVNLRVCGIDDWDFDNRFFNNEFHNVYADKAVWDADPVMLGASGIYRNTGPDEFLDSKMREVYDGPCDVGEFSQDDLNEVLRRISSGNLAVRHLDPVAEKTPFMMWELIDGDGDRDDDRTLFGILPWKIFDAYFVEVKRVGDFLASRSEVIEEIHSALNQEPVSPRLTYAENAREEELATLIEIISN